MNLIGCENSAEQGALSEFGQQTQDEARVHPTSGEYYSYVGDKLGVVGLGMNRQQGYGCRLGVFEELSRSKQGVNRTG